MSGHSADRNQEEVSTPEPRTVTCDPSPLQRWEAAVEPLECTGGPRGLCSGQGGSESQPQGCPLTAPCVPLLIRVRAWDVWVHTHIAKLREVCISSNQLGKRCQRERGVLGTHVPLSRSLIHN